jgi:hypothetical protein
LRNFEEYLGAWAEVQLAGANIARNAEIEAKSGFREQVIAENSVI